MNIERPCFLCNGAKETQAKRYCDLCISKCRVKFGVRFVCWKCRNEVLSPDDIQTNNLCKTCSRCYWRCEKYYDDQQRDHKDFTAALKRCELALERLKTSRIESNPDKNIVMTEITTIVLEDFLQRLKNSLQ